MKTILKFKSLLVTLFFLTIAVSSLTATTNKVCDNSNFIENGSVTIICPNCGQWNWTLIGYWFEDEWIVTSMMCDFCGYTKYL